VYVDLDVVPLKSFEPLLGLDAFVGWEDERRLCPSVMGFSQGHASLNEFIDFLVEWVRDHVGEKDPVVLTGPVPFTAFFAGREDIIKLPPISFYPFHYTELDLVEQFKVGEITPAKESYCVHLWNKGWAK